MLGSFHLYPTASLLTELVQIFQGKYIVKASLQIEGVTRVTGMAAAETLEDAEDRARVRVITIFGEVPNIQPQPAVVEAPKPDAAAISMDTSSRILEPIAATAVQQTEPTLPIPDVAIGTNTIEKEAAPVTEPVQVVSPKPEVVAPITGIEKQAPFTEPVQVLSSQPEVVAPITVIEKEAPYTQPIQVVSPKAITDEHSVPTPSKVQPEEVAVQASNVINTTKTRNARSEVTLQETIAFDSTPEVNIAPPINQEISQVTPITIKPEPIPEPLFDRPLEIATETQTELPLTAVAPPSNVTPFVPRNYNPPTEIGIPEVPSTGLTTTKRTKKTTQPKDNSDDIAKIAVEMERLRWTIEQGRDYLFKTYGQKSRHTLSDDQLRDFREYLESQPTPTDDPLAIDPIAGF